MKLLNEIKNMLLSEDEQTVVLGIRLLLNTDSEIIKTFVDRGESKFSLGDIDSYYNYTHKLHMNTSPMWYIIKRFPVNEKFCMYSIQRDILLWGLRDGSSN